MTTASLKVETVDEMGIPVSEITTYLLTPRNAVSVGRPYTRIEILPSSSVKPDQHGVQVTARWGWSAVPETIKIATLIQAGRFWERRTNPGGALASERVDDIQRDWSTAASQDLDPEVLAMVKPYRKPPWAAA
ncbi:hypothetical protein QN239_19205 [Mycolicibacterium sp. Y3]